MAPGYRVNNQSRRANRSYVDHDVFEGLPVRNWRREIVTITPPPVHEVTAQKDKWDVEIPWGMPKDSHLLPQHSQDLLRAARSGRLYVRRPAVEEEEAEPETTGGEKPEKKEEDLKEKGFTVKTWKLVPRHLEGPEIEYLAKRRKGLTGQPIKSTVNNPPPMTKATVRRTDAAGNSYVENVVLQQGQAIQGEVLSQRVIPSTNIEGAVGSSLPVQPTQQRRKHPAPKRKSRRAASSRRRKIPLPPTTIPSKPGNIRVEAGMHHPGSQGSAIGPDGIKIEPSTIFNNENEIEDTEMGDDSGPASDDEGEEGSDDERDGPGDGEEEEADQPIVQLEQSQTNETNEGPDLEGDEDHRRLHERDISSSPDLPLAKMASGMSHDPGSAGSPLKNVITFTSTYDEQSPNVHSEDGAEAQDLNEINDADVKTILRGEADVDGGQDGYCMPGLEMPTEHQDSRSNTLSDSNNAISMQHDGAYDGNEMLLDVDEPIVAHVAFSSLASQDPPLPHQQPILESTYNPIFMSLSDHDQQGHITAFDPRNQNINQFDPLGSMSKAPLDKVDRGRTVGWGHEEEQNQIQAPAPAPAANEKDSQDTFEDLLGSLEDHLDAHDHVSIPAPNRPTAAAAQFKSPALVEAGSEVTATAVEPEKKEAVDEEGKVLSVPVSAPLAGKKTGPLTPVEANRPAYDTLTDAATAFVDAQAETMNAAAEDYGVNFVIGVHVPGGSGAGAGAVFANVGSKSGGNGDGNGKT